MLFSSNFVLTLASFKTVVGLRSGSLVLTTSIWQPKMRSWCPGTSAHFLFKSLFPALARCFFSRLVLRSMISSVLLIKVGFLHDSQCVIVHCIGGQVFLAAIQIRSIHLMTLTSLYIWSGQHPKPQYLPCWIKHIVPIQTC